MKPQKYFWLLCHSILIRIRNISKKIVGKNKTHILFSITFLKIRVFYEIVWKNSVEPEKIHMTIRRMRIACWIPKSTNIHSEYVIFIAILYVNCLFFTLLISAYDVCKTYICVNLDSQPHTWRMWTSITQLKLEFLICLICLMMASS
jgi:hypothetical protein